MNILVLGGAGFIGSHTAKRLKKEGHFVRVVDIKLTEYFNAEDFCSEFVKCDLRIKDCVDEVFNDYHWDWVFQYAALMGGAGYIFTGDNDADIMYSSALINLNVVEAAVNHKVGRLFYSSSACIYNQNLQKERDNPGIKENTAWPLNPDSDYGIEKAFSEKLYKAHERNYGLQIRIARFHNIFGPQGTWKGGKEKAPAAICRKVVEAIEGFPGYIHGADNIPDIPVGRIDIWGSGEQTRSFLYIDECVEGVVRLMESDCTEIVNIGSDEMISINDLAKMAIEISGKKLTINNISGPTGVMGRNSNNELIYEKLGWKPTAKLRDGIEKLYKWINEQ